MNPAAGYIITLLAALSIKESRGSQANAQWNIQLRSFVNTTDYDTLLYPRASSFVFGEGLYSSQFIRSVMRLSELYAVREGLLFFSIYTDSPSPTLLLWLKSRPISHPVGVGPCSSFALPSDATSSRLRGRAKTQERNYGLNVLFCERKQQEIILREALSQNALLPSHWFLPLETDKTSLQDDVFLPLDSMVVEIVSAPDDPSFLQLRDVWSPGLEVPHKTGTVGLYRHQIYKNKKVQQQQDQKQQIQESHRMLQIKPNLEINKYQQIIANDQVKNFICLDEQNQQETVKITSEKEVSIISKMSHEQMMPRVSPFKVNEEILLDLEPRMLKYVGTKYHYTTLKDKGFARSTMQYNRHNSNEDCSNCNTQHKIFSVEFGKDSQVNYQKNAENSDGILLESNKRIENKHTVASLLTQLENFDNSSSVKLDGCSDFQMVNTHALRRRMDLTGIHFVVTSINNTKAHRSYYDRARSRYVMTGLFGEIFEMMRETMNFTYSVVTPPDGEYGALDDDGNWTGLVADILSHRADVAVAFLSTTETRFTAVSYTTRVVNFRYRIYAMVPSTAGLLWTSYSRPFTLQLWSFVLALFLLLSGVFAITSKGYKYIKRMKMAKKTVNTETNKTYMMSRQRHPGNLSPFHSNVRKKKTFTKAIARQSTGISATGEVNMYNRSLGKQVALMKDRSLLDNESENNVEAADKPKNYIFDQWCEDSLMIVWSSFVQQGWPIEPDEGILRVVFWTSYCTSLILLAAYSATLHSLMTVVDKSLPFDSLESLSALDNYRLGIQPGSVTEEFLTSPHLIKHYNKLVAPFSDTLHRDHGKLVERATEDPRYAVLGTYEVQRSTQEGACKLVPSKQNVMFNDGSLGLQKGSHYVPLFSLFISQLRETGILDRLLLKYYPSFMNCSDTVDMAMGMRQVFTAFLALLGGAATALLGLLIEKYYHKFMLKKAALNRVKS